MALADYEVENDIVGLDRSELTTQPEAHDRRSLQCSWSGERDEASFDSLGGGHMGSETSTEKKDLGSRLQADKAKASKASVL